MEKNGQNRYLYNSVTAGWNYTVRMYETKPKIISGTWSFPKAQPAK
jgi:hypothetical protein